MKPVRADILQISRTSPAYTAAVSYSRGIDHFAGKPSLKLYFRRNFTVRPDDRLFIIS